MVRLRTEHRESQTKKKRPPSVRRKRAAGQATKAGIKRGDDVATRMEKWEFARLAKNHAKRSVKVRKDLSDARGGVA